MHGACTGRTGAHRLDVSSQPRRRAGRGLASFPGSLKLIPWAHPGLDGLRARAVAQGNVRESEASPFSHVHAQQPLPSHVVLSSCIAVSLPAPVR